MFGFCKANSTFMKSVCSLIFMRRRATSIIKKETIKNNKIEIVL